MKWLCTMLRCNRQIREPVVVGQRDSMACFTRVTKLFISFQVAATKLSALNSTENQVSQGLGMEI